MEILSAVTKGGSRPRLGLSVNMEQLGTDSRCDGFSGADVGNLVRQVDYIKFKFFCPLLLPQYQLTLSLGVSSRLKLSSESNFC